HQSRETTLADRRVDRFSGVGEQDSRAVGAKHLTQLRPFDTGNQENAGLLNLNNVSHLFTQFGRHRHRQNYFVLVVADLVVRRVQIQVNLRLPLLLKNQWRVRRFKREVLHIDTLKGKLGLVLVFVACGLLILSHDQSRSEEHTSELQSRENIVCRLLLVKKKI